MFFLFGESATVTLGKKCIAKLLAILREHRLERFELSLAP
jgi:hypothetical protein